MSEVPLKSRATASRRGWAPKFTRLKEVVRIDVPLLLLGRAWEDMYPPRTASHEKLSNTQYQIPLGIRLQR